MISRDDARSWLQGPPKRPSQGPDDASVTDDYPGARLGMPRAGVGSIATFGRRLIAILIDWTLCQIIAIGIFQVPVGEGGRGSWMPLAIFAVENLILVSTTGSTLGHRLLGIGVRRLDGSFVRPQDVLIRTGLLCLAIPALVWDRDGRGLHDRGAGTVIVRR